MKEMKFRAWNGTEMSDVINPFYDNSFWFSDDEGDAIFVNDADLSGLILMQFIGLNDKNNNEIFEGDILKRSWNLNNVPDSYCYITFEFGCYGFRWIDVNNEEDEGFFPFYSDENKDFRWSPDDFEIAGNIHENPKLLKNNR